MLTEKQSQEYLILKSIAETTEPVGSGSIGEKMRAGGFEISEATVGRILRNLDLQQYTERIGYQGRILTANGKQRLKELEIEKERNRFDSEFLQSLRYKNKSDLIDILVARRAIEGEIARLAAFHATSEQIKSLKLIVQEQEAKIINGQKGTEVDIRFHKMLAQMAENRVLEAAIDLIRKDNELSPFLEFLKNKVDAYNVKDHKLIIEAIADKNPELAFQAMISHIQNLIRIVELHWDKEYRNLPDPGSE